MYFASSLPRRCWVQTTSQIQKNKLNPQFHFWLIFRRSDGQEINDQFSNYKKLMDHMNSQKSFNVQARFGTLSDYFLSVWNEAQVSPGEKPPGYSTLSGDFFTYADRQDNYWHAPLAPLTANTLPFAPTFSVLWVPYVVSLARCFLP